MTPTETVRLVQLVRQIAPAQKIDEFTPDAWQPLLEDVPLQDALAAVKALGRRQPFIGPSDIANEVAAMRKARTENADKTFVYTGDPDDTAEYRRQLVEHRRAVAAGREPAQPELSRRVPMRQIENLFPSVPGRRS